MEETYTFKPIDRDMLQKKLEESIPEKVLIFLNELILKATNDGFHKFSLAVFTTDADSIIDDIYHHTHAIKVYYGRRGIDLSISKPYDYGDLICGKKKENVIAYDFTFDWSGIGDYPVKVEV